MYFGIQLKSWMRILSQATCQSWSGRMQSDVLTRVPRGWPYPKSEAKGVFFSGRVDLILGSQPVETCLSFRVVAGLFELVVPWDDVFLFFAYFQFFLYVFVDMFNVVHAGGSLYHDPFLVADIEFDHEEGWKTYVDRLIWALETLGLDDHEVGIHYLYVGDFLEVIPLM